MARDFECGVAKESCRITRLRKIDGDFLPETEASYAVRQPAENATVSEVADID